MNGITRLFAVPTLILMLSVISCGGGGGEDIVDATGNDIPGIDAIIYDTYVPDTTDVREDVPVTPDVIVDVIADTTPDEIVGQDIPAEIPETCECLGDEDCGDAFDDLGMCEKAVCNACSCVKEFTENGGACDDDNECTTGETCDADHICGGGTNTCTCSADSDCERYDDDNLCNGSFKCNTTLVTPVCEIDPETIVTCEDTLGLFCRTVGCDPETGNCVDVFIHQDEACNDEVACTLDDKCVDGVCIGTLDDGTCNDNDVCTDEYCDNLQGCVYVNNSNACEDGNACTENDQCDSGVCMAGTELDCNDDNICTIDECDPGLGCTYENAVDLACDDFDACTTASTCLDGNCVAVAEGCCNDNTDNDNDSLTDCEDPDCVGACPVEMFDCSLVSPASFSGPAGADFTISASVTKSGVTDRTTGFDGHPLLRVQYAIGPDNTIADALSALSWTDATPDEVTEDPDSDFWTGTVIVPEITDMFLKRDYMVRASGDSGSTWSYCDLDGNANGYDYNQAGKLTIEPPYQLLFSEYMEGLSNNKAVEVFNAGQFAAYLGDCSIAVYANGAVTPTNTFTLNNIDLEPGETFTVCHDLLALGSRVFCDMSNTKINHNGDDAISLTCNGIVQDIFGVIGVRPDTNWGSGMTATKDHTLRRDCSITTGTGPDVTTWDESQWIGFPVDTWQGFGTRLCDGECYFNEAETCCLDTIDNDLDGMLDCDDPGCRVTEACFVPVDWCQYFTPAYVRGSIGMTGTAFMWLYAAGMTDATIDNDNPADVQVQFGYGPGDTMPDENWMWNDATPASFNSAPREDADTYWYKYVIPDVPEGSYDMAFRASADGGYSWTLCDLNGSDDGYTLDQAGEAVIVSMPNVFFSEYVDGSVNDKALEIFNNSGRDLDLGNCSIAVFKDGATTSTVGFILNDGLLANHDTFVVCKDTVSPELAGYCDELRSLLDFNGNDTIELVCEDKLQDVIGQRGVDPGATGWGSGDNTTALHTLRRHCNIAIGDLIESDVFDPAVEWYAYPMDTFLGLGSMQCGDVCALDGIESCCGDDIDNDLDGVADCMDEDCAEAEECQPLLVELGMLDMPISITYEFGGMSPNVFGRAFLTGVTSNPGQGAGIIAEAGWGPDGSYPEGNPDWIWMSASFFSDIDVSDDQYTAQFMNVPVGIWDYAFRFTADAGGHWLYADAIPNGSIDGYDPSNAGSMTVTEGIEILCNDGADNDGDLDVDCADFDCVLALNCMESTNCDDGQDNDGDGATDCADSDCDTATNCMESANCYDEIDNDGDGITDCADPDCATVCVEAGSCDDMFDNDMDGFTDCEDTDCNDDAACQEPVDWCQLRPMEPIISHPGYAFQIFGWVYEPGMTDTTANNDNPAGLTGQVGWGPAGSDPATWTWTDAAPAPGGNSAPSEFADTYYYNLTVPSVVTGEYDIAFRFSADGGRSWLLCDQDGSDNFYQPAQAGKMTVTTPPNMIFTEYVEGSGNNKALEITNLSGRTVMKNACSIRGFNNGSASSAYAFALEGSGYLADGETWVVCDNDADPALLAYCDSTSGLLSFNGNDTLVLNCENVNMDVFGQVGFDPGAAGWGSGDIMTTDTTLRRSCAISAGDTDSSDAFDPTAEWFAFPVDTFLELGQWTCGDACYVGAAEKCCGDGGDNDFDGLTDCDDSDCTDDVACIPTNETDCTDGVDEDMDGVTDCADTDCIAEATCPVETDCNDGADNDGDGLTDCEDYNCDGDAICPAKVMFSEYGEGSSNNKWVEVWNYGTATRDLSTCQILVFSNGSNTPGTPTVPTQTTSTPGDIWTVCHTSITTTGTTCDQKSTNINFNGNDAVVLICNSTVRDSIGQVGFDPGSVGWGSGDTTTANDTLCRMIRTPDGDPSDAFDPTIQWRGYPQDFFGGMDILACQ